MAGAPSDAREDHVRLGLGAVGKRKGRQRDTAFSTISDAEFRLQFYDRRAEFDDATRLRIEREAKVRKIRNVQKRTSG